MINSQRFNCYYCCSFLRRSRGHHLFSRLVGEEGCVKLDGDCTAGLGLFENLLWKDAKRDIWDKRYVKTFVEGMFCDVMRSINYTS